MNDLMNAIPGALLRKDPTELLELSAQIMAFVNELDPDGSIYTADRIAVMGYDMERPFEDVKDDPNTPENEYQKGLTEAERQRDRKCYSYEVYKNSTNFVTQLRCCGEFLQDAAECLMQNASN